MMKEAQLQFRTFNLLRSARLAACDGAPGPGGLPRRATSNGVGCPSTGGCTRTVQRRSSKSPSSPERWSKTGRV